jgi:hypothetical protein
MEYTIKIYINFFIVLSHLNTSKSKYECKKGNGRYNYNSNNDY